MGRSSFAKHIGASGIAGPGSRRRAPAPEARSSTTPQGQARPQRAPDRPPGGNLHRSGEREQPALHRHPQWRPRYRRSLDQAAQRADRSRIAERRAGSEASAPPRSPGLARTRQRRSTLPPHRDRGGQRLGDLGLVTHTIRDHPV